MLCKWIFMSIAGGQRRNWISSSRGLCKLMLVINQISAVDFDSADGRKGAAATTTPRRHNTHNVYTQSIPFKKGRESRYADDNKHASSYIRVRKYYVLLQRKCWRFCRSLSPLYVASSDGRVHPETQCRHINYSTHYVWMADAAAVALVAIDMMKHQWSSRLANAFVWILNFERSEEHIWRML